MIMKGLLGHAAEGRGGHGSDYDYVDDGYVDYGYIYDGYIYDGYIYDGYIDSNGGRGILGSRGIMMMRGRGDGLQ